jgi:hypothetical protein
MLLEKRKEIGRRTNKLPFHIMPNDAIRHLADHPVKTVDEFKAIQGIGQARADLYFNDFFGVITQYEMIQADPGAFGVEAVGSSADDHSASANFDWNGGEGAAKARSNFGGGASADQPISMDSDDEDFDMSPHKKYKT